MMFLYNAQSYYVENPVAQGLMKNAVHFLKRGETAKAQRFRSEAARVEQGEDFPRNGLLAALSYFEIPSAA